MNVTIRTRFSADTVVQAQFGAADLDEADVRALQGRSGKRHDR
jgi:hypothetical protein